MPDNLPRKLRKDPIIEAVLEIRFEPDAVLLPEITFARFADVGEWKGFRQARLASADIPPQVRQLDANLRYLPSYELTSPDGEASIRIGPYAIAYSSRGAYPGWDKFGPELARLVDRLYTVMPGVLVNRIGLRYVNALRSDNHGIRSVSDMNISISASGKTISSSLVLNFKSNIGSHLEVISRIATVDLVQGVIPENATIILDIDVYTGDGFSSKDAEEIKGWVEKAHTEERAHFFLLLGNDASERLREDR